MGASNTRRGFPELGRLLTTARRVCTRRGLSDAVNWRAQAFAYHVRQWWYRDHPVLGLLVELAGNRVRIDGCRFDVSHPEISRAIRSRLVRGRYERAELHLLRRWLEPDSPVVELGGGIGVVATLVNRRLSDPARHVVVEANPSLIPVINRQRTANEAHFRVEHGAVD